MGQTKRQNKVFNQLETKLRNNLKLCLKENRSLQDEVELKARAVSVLGQILIEQNNLLPHQKEITSIFDEVFSDLIISIYLAGCALDKPAQVVLRRALELGISIVYLWDLPHAFWGWKSHDSDLSYSDMLDYLTKPSYATFIQSLNTKLSDDLLFEEKEARRLYRILSNTTHGKITTFESNLPERFKYSAIDWEYHLNLVQKVEQILLDLWNIRFFDWISELYKRIPAISRYK